ncbi:MAG: response regulator [Nitrospiraceae bacterium]|nr:response regulator [Nitrospiraceae bacterium]
MRGKSLLVVDDEESFLQLVEWHYSLQGVKVERALTLGEASEKLYVRTPDAVLLDLMLPDGSGMDFFEKRLRGNTPTVLISGFGEDYTEREFTDKGGYGFLQKPSAMSDIDLKISGAIKSHRERFCVRADIEIVVETTPDRVAVKNPSDVFEMLRFMGQLDREMLCVVHMDSQGMSIKTEMVSLGTQSSLLTHQREIFKNAVRNGAASIILAHNHPSGKLEASEQDKELTRSVFLSGEVLGIHLLDHLVIGGNSFLSIQP